MNLKIATSESGGNKSSCAKLVNYLEKENEKKEPLEKRYFFSDDQDMVSSHRVVEEIDSNHHKLGRNDAKFFMVVISPSEKELEHIGSSEKKLMDYTRTVMNEYAVNFNKGLRGEDLLWFAKVEEFRKERNPDKVHFKNQHKEGLQWHIHVIVSRYDKQKRYKLSPLTNHRNTEKGVAKGGFDRNTFRQNGERAFDKMFNYSRTYSETWEYQNTMKNGKVMDKHFVGEKLRLENNKESSPQFNGSRVSSTTQTIQKLLSVIGKGNKMTSHEEEEEEKKSKGKGMGM